MPRKNEYATYYEGSVSLPEMNRVIEDVCAAIGVSVAEIRTRRKTGSFVRSRKIAVWVLNKVTRLSLMQLGFLFKRHHTSIMYLIQSWTREMDNNPALRSEMARVLWVVWRAKQARRFGRKVRVDKPALVNLRHEDGRLSEEKRYRLARKLRRTEIDLDAALVGTSAVAWNDRDDRGTSEDFFRAQNDRAVAHMRKMLRLEQEERKALVDGH